MKLTTQEQAKALTTLIRQEAPEIAVQIRRDGRSGDYWLSCARVYAHSDGYVSFELLEVRSMPAWDRWKAQIRMTTNEDRKATEAMQEAEKEAVRRRETFKLLPMYQEPDAIICPVPGCDAELSAIRQEGEERFVCPRAISEVERGPSGRVRMREDAIHAGVVYYKRTPQGKAGQATYSVMSQMRMRKEGTGNV